MNKIIEYIENSFLSTLLKDKNISDISYNGADIFCEHKIKGRFKADLAISKDEVGSFLRQLANYAEKQFSYQSPILDFSTGRYRINAVFSNIVRVGEEKSLSFCIRICDGTINLDENFIGGRGHEILLEALKNNESIVIAGSTSSGKTELQKYLISKLSDSKRVIVIDNVKELELVRHETNLDLTTWVVDDNFSTITFGSLIKNALRNNPDYIILAESRGQEAMEVVNSAMSGHPIITTIHAKNLTQSPSRLARLCLLAGKNLIYEDILENIYDSFSYFVYCKKSYENSGNIKRYIQSIGKINRETKKLDILYMCQEGKE